jgi:hypothetical protein
VSSVVGGSTCWTLWTRRSFTRATIARCSPCPPCSGWLTGSLPVTGTATGVNRATGVNDKLEVVMIFETLLKCHGCGEVYSLLDEAEKLEAHSRVCGGVR